MSGDAVTAEPAFGSVIAMPTLLCEGCLTSLVLTDEIKPTAKTLTVFCGNAAHACVLSGVLLQIPLMRMRALQVGHRSMLVAP